MKLVHPTVRLLARPDIDWPQLSEYLDSVGAHEWLHARYYDQDVPDGEYLAEAAGRVCYRSWAPGLNPNVTKVRDDRGAYLRNILSSGHGSVLEHANYTFVFSNVSRVLTAELNRHRAGVAVSEQSLRYVKVNDIPVWLPEWAQRDTVLMEIVEEHLRAAEALQARLTEHLGFHEPGMPFKEKKEKTSFLRRFLPMGTATEEIWTANVRTLRHVIEKRTDPAAEEEIRHVFGQVTEIMSREAPMLFGDFAGSHDGTYAPKWSKV